MFHARSIPIVLLGMVCGASLCLATQWGWHHASDSRSQNVIETPTLVVRLHRFSLKPDKLEEFEDWVRFEHDHHAETLQTLEREKMYAEAIFRDHDHDAATIYWLEIRGAGGATTEHSSLPVDKIYGKYMEDTLIPHSRTTMNPEYVLIPEFLQSSISQHFAGGSQDQR